jgi:hypothetical protein
MWHAWERGDVFTGFWLGGPNVRDHWEELRRRWEDNIKLDLREREIDGRNGFGWLKIGSSGGPL